jgi:hypothetical protein
LVPSFEEAPEDFIGQYEHSAIGTMGHDAAHADACEKNNCRPME